MDRSHNASKPAAGSSTRANDNKSSNVNRPSEAQNPANCQVCRVFGLPKNKKCDACGTFFTPLGKDSVKSEDYALGNDSATTNVYEDAKDARGHRKVDSKLDSDPISPESPTSVRDDSGQATQSTSKDGEALLSAKTYQATEEPERNEPSRSVVSSSQTVSFKSLKQAHTQNREEKLRRWAETSTDPEQDEVLKETGIEPHDFARDDALKAKRKRDS
ncbi:hypothetical protein HBH69_042140 [Parastagonospora nodorum]|nr:hypothetical protein HBI04_221940 [Parastagonospora nodorum]KAH4267346.1 hypothetical protein HBI03_069050 [Parastagonospora nodorum]KAH5161074.1 hypothetical protein HBH69_042140 [Parastagonospora nodorum]KAH5431469.1 hypothetical protein HBI32_060930 [Parastagonospora nodorum]KAH6050479.1 hypothetical protein HBI54_044350 [Parastagonospora nodorum]